MKTFPIESFPAGAVEALGGEPILPPVPSMTPAVGMAPIAAPPDDSMGHPTFDPTPREIRVRREKTDAARTALAALARTMRRECAALSPLLDDLAPDARLLLRSELFDVKAARSFVDGAARLVDDLTSIPTTEEAV